MKFEINMENMIKLLIPLSIIILIVFLFFRNRNVEPYDNFPSNIKNMIEQAARKEVAASVNKPNNQQCGPNFAPTNQDNFRLNAGQQGSVGPSCNHPGYGAPIQQMPPGQMPPGQMPPVQMPQGYVPPQQMAPAPVPQPVPPPAPAPAPAAAPPKPPTPPKIRNPVPPGKSAEIKMVWAQWCGFSRKAAPEFEALRNKFANQEYNGYKLVFNDYEEGHDDFREFVTKYEIRGFPTYVVIVKDGDTELHVGNFNSIKTDDMETKFKKEIDEAKK